MPNLTGWHLLIIVAVIVLLFGAAKLPALARSMGQSARVFKSEMKAMKDDDAGAETPAAAGDAPATGAVPAAAVPAAAVPAAAVPAAAAPGTEQISSSPRV